MLTDGRTTDGQTTDAGVTGILIAHLGAFGSGELISKIFFNSIDKQWRLRQACTSMQPRQSLLCLPTQNMDIDEDSNQILEM